jgi:hypothetical protein
LSLSFRSRGRSRRRIFVAALSTVLACALAPLTAASPASAADPDAIKILRAEWFTSGGANWLSVEAQTTVPTGNTLTVTWAGGSAVMNNYTDVGVYLYHRFNTPIRITGAIPTTVTVTSSLGGTASAPVDEWLEGGFQLPAGYKTRFVTGPKPPDPTETNRRLEALATEFPTLAEIITMPELTNGYRRKAQLQFPVTPTTPTTATAPRTFFVTSHEYTAEDITMALVNPGVANSALSVTVVGKDITVNLGTDAAGALSSTAAQVVAAINASTANTLLTAYTYRRNAGAGVVEPAVRANLSDFLTAPASIARAPFQMKVLRVGKVRDGSKTGVFLYAGEHSNEITPVYATLETAERLLRNYATDAWTRKAIDNLDIFILPWTNPDGGHHSIYEPQGLRKNMTNACDPADSDPGRRANWGVNLNRNFGVASLFDGYEGADANCLGGNYAGPREESEPETRNQIWLANRFTNIKFAMNTHCCGGLFMWTPGAYIEEGRVSVPRPNAGIEQYYYEAAEHILDGVQQWRDTAVWPGRTGPIVDVLYSAAGNSADYFWIEHGWLSWAFETNGPRFNPTTQSWVNGSNTVDVEETAMEYSNGLLGIVDVALEFELDATAPDSQLVVKSRNATTTTFSFETSEAAAIYYTLDGSKPTLQSTQLQTAGLREGAESLTVSKGTVVNWMAVDPRGNVQNGYSSTGALPLYESFALVAGGTAYDDLDATLSLYLLNDRTPQHVVNSLQDRLDRAAAAASAGSESRAIGYLEQFISRARNQIKGDAADVVARNTLIDAAQRLIGELRAADVAENAAA